MNQSTPSPTLPAGLQTGNVVAGQVGNTNPLQAGSIVALPPGSVVNVNINGKIVPVKTVPAPGVAQTTPLPVPPPTLSSTTLNVPGPTSSVVQTQTLPVTTSTNVQLGSTVNSTIPLPPTTVPFSTQSIQVPTQSTFVQNQTVDLTSSGPQSPPTPTVRTLPPRIVKNQLPPKYNTVTLPPKVVQTRLTPIGPPPTPQLSLPTPPVVTLPPTTSTQSVTLPPPVQSVSLPTTVQSQTLVSPPLTATTSSIQTIPGAVQTYGTPYATSSINSLPFATTSVGGVYGTTSVGPITAPFGSSSIANVGYGNSVLTSSTTPAVGSSVGYGTASMDIYIQIHAFVTYHNHKHSGIEHKHVWNYKGGNR